MVDWRKLIVAIAGVLALSAAVHADMVPVSQLGAEYRSPEQACSRVELLRTGPSSPFDSLSTAGLSPGLVEFFPETSTDVTQSSEMPSPQILTSGPSSLSLCLSALLGLGFYSSTHWVKKLHFGIVPEWYHEGGPFQIGHSYAVMPNSLCPVPAYCFVQPVLTAECCLSRYRLRTITSLSRNSQFTPSVLESRGPPVRT